MGRGGMGEVWRAHDTATNNRVVAIKLLPSHLAIRTAREADAALERPSTLGRRSMAMQVHRADAVNCLSGEKAPGTTSFTIDAVTLNGTAVATTDGPACGYSTPYTGDPSALTLTKVG